MAGRPQKLTLDFFIHDKDARNDRRIRALCRRHGNDGYASYFRLLEILCGESNLRLDVSEALDAEMLAEDLYLRDVAHLYQILETCAEVGLINKQLWTGERVLFSDALHRRFVERLEKRKSEATRKKSSREARSLQASIDNANGIVTPDNSIVTPDNAGQPRDNTNDIVTADDFGQPRDNVNVTPDNSIVTRDNANVTRDNRENTEYRIQKTELRTQNSENRTTKTREVKTDRYFHNEPKSRDGGGKIACAWEGDPRFSKFVEHMTAKWSSRGLTKADVRRSLVNARYDEQKREKAEIEWEEFLAQDLTPQERQRSKELDLEEKIRQVDLLLEMEN